MKKRFSFLFPITQESPDPKREGGMHFNHIADLEINGLAFIDSIETNKLPDYKIDSITYNGLNAFPFVEAFTTMESIKAACINHLESLLNQVFNISKPAAKLVTVGKS